MLVLQADDRLTRSHNIKELPDCNRMSINDEVLSSSRPLVLRGLVSDWPIVKAGLHSPDSVADYIRKFYNDRPLTASYAPPEIGGRVGYNANFTGFNFQKTSVTLDEFLARVFEHIDQPNPPASYVGSTLLDTWFPGLRQENDLELGVVDPLVSLWIGNQIRVSAHFDFPDNIACCVAGRRRFTLFPPEQIDNLYIGPWDFNPAGPAISLVDLRDPDFNRYPRFREALEAAQEVTLEPGDALFLPSMWWHNVEGLDGLNMLVNFWWRSTPAFMGTPYNVLKHALLALRDLPVEQRRAWQHILDYYIFDNNEDAIAHIPELRRGMLGPLDENSARRLRADLLNQLNR